MSDKVRFLFHFYDLEQRAGIQRAICELSNALVEKNHEVAVASATQHASMAYHLDPRVQLLLTPYPEYKHSGIRAWPFKAAWALRQTSVIRALARQVRPDIIVDHGTALGLLYPFGTLDGIPFVLQRHFPGRSFPCGGLLYRLLSMVCLSKVVVVLTDGIAHEMRSLGFRHIIVIPNVIPVEAKPASWPETEPRIGLLLGRAASPQKGFDLFLRALAQSQPPGWRFVIAGPGVESHPQLLELVSRHKLSSCVSLLPATNDPYALIRQSSLLIAPSRYEALPMVVLEALSIGRPVLASDAEGLREVVIPKLNGEIVPAGDVDKLSAALMHLCGNPGFLYQLAASAPSSIARYHRKEVVRAWIELAMRLDATG